MLNLLAIINVSYGVFEHSLSHELTLTHVARPFRASSSYYTVYSWSSLSFSTWSTTGPIRCPKEHLSSTMELTKLSGDTHPTNLVLGPSCWLLIGVRRIDWCWPTDKFSACLCLLEPYWKVSVSPVLTTELIHLFTVLCLVPLWDLFSLFPRFFGFRVTWYLLPYTVRGLWGLFGI